MSVAISSKRYAEAVFQIANEKNELDEWLIDLKKIARLMEDEQFAFIIQNPVIPFQLKAELTEGKLGKVNPILLNFTFLLIHKNKFKNANQIAQEYEHLLDEFILWESKVIKKQLIYI